MQLYSSTQLPYTEDDFKLIREIIYNYAGIYISDDYQSIFMRRLERRLLSLSMDSFHEYYYYLKYNQPNNDELRNLMDVITIKETYFFRELDQMKTLINEVLPELSCDEHSERLLENSKNEDEVDLESSKSSAVEFTGYNDTVPKIRGATMHQKLKAGLAGKKPVKRCSYKI